MAPEIEAQEGTHDGAVTVAPRQSPLSRDIAVIVAPLEVANELPTPNLPVITSNC